ncbi:MAG: exonuclease domain-containing protein [Desulfosarcinaceae bacterium]
MFLLIFLKEHSLYFLSFIGLLLIGLGLLLDGLIHTYVLPINKIIEETTLISTVNPAHRITTDGSPDVKLLVEVINHWADLYQRMQANIGQEIQYSQENDSQWPKVSMRTEDLITAVCRRAETQRDITLLTESHLPEFYDFDLFNPADLTDELGERLLKKLSYTVFDMETTGLDPRGGDEIISLGAVRIVNGRLLSEEQFDQFVDPRRPLGRESMRIHGIRPEMLKGQPSIERALPLFHQFCEDTVLVAHNAAFDMLMLKLKEAVCGVRFSQPVLDTLLLSDGLLPAHRSHDLEEVARRFGVRVRGRHTALGDALTTAEIWLKMMPLLASKGISTLNDAVVFSKRSPYARLRH